MITHMEAIMGTTMETMRLGTVTVAILQGLVRITITGTALCGH